MHPKSLHELDFVYLTKKSHVNEELRYSLRSLKNIPHGRVWLVGFKPNWTTDLLHLPTRQKDGDKYANSWLAFQQLCASDDLTEHVVVMNDDFFVLEPVSELPPVHRGLAGNKVARWKSRTRHRYASGGLATLQVLEKWGFSDVKDYELHMPVVIKRSYMLNVLNAYRRETPVLPAHKRTLYGNYYKVGGVEIEDCKVFGAKDELKPGAFVSTTDLSFSAGIAGNIIRGMFSEPGPYEQF